MKEEFIEMYGLEDFTIQTVKKMKKADLEKDIIKFAIQWNKIEDFIDGKKIITPSGIRYLKKLLIFSDED